MANTTSPTRQDPIGVNYYQPLQYSDCATTWIFYLGGSISFGPLFINQTLHPVIYSVALRLFVIMVIVGFIINMTNRLYFFPRAEDARRKEFLSNAFDFDLLHERTHGYYNNDEKDPIRRIGVLTLENLFFSKAILHKMAPSIRAKAFAYFLAWIAAALWRDLPQDWVLAAAQVIFSEEIISRWLRLEWARNRAENIYSFTHRLYQMNPQQDKLAAYAIAAFADYESGKTLAGILLSSKIFTKYNKTLSAEWEIVKSGLPLTPP